MLFRSESLNITGMVIKSHHNVGGLPAKMNLKVVEPLRLLFKDEVRRVGRELGIPASLIGRHPFPGPGLGVRILGDVTADKVRILQEAEAWVINKNTDKYESLLQKIGFHTINLDLEKYQNIKAYLLNVNGYTNDKMLAYERIVSVSGISNLDVSVKLELIDFFQNSDFMQGIGINKYFKIGRAHV